MSRVVPAALLAALLLPRPDALAASAGLVVARHQVSVARAAVRLSDLFSGLDASADRDIGPAPAPGRSITVPEPQLAAIAAQFGVDWLPDPDAPPIILRRAGRTVTRDDLLAVLEPALGVAGNADSSRVTVFPFESPVLPAEAPVQPEITQLTSPGTDGRFSATLSFPLADADPVVLRVSGRVEQTIRGLVLTRALPMNAVLAPDDVAVARIERGRSAEAPLADPAGAVGFPLARAAAAGTPVTATLLSHPPTIARNHPVVLRLEQGGLALTASGIAMEAGTLGETIHVLNVASHAVLLGQVVDGNDIRIMPGSAPLSSGAADPGRIAPGNGRVS